MIVTGGRVFSGVTTRVYDDSGNPLWTANHMSEVRTVAADINGNVYTGGVVASDTRTTRKYNYSGALQWSVNHGATVWAIAVDSAGNVYTGGVPAAGYTTRKYNSSGTLQWSVNHGDWVNGIAVNSDTVITGSDSGAVPELKTYSLSGTPGFSRDYTETILGVCSDSSGNIYMANVGASANNKLRRLNSAGTETLVLLPAAGYAYSVAVDESGNMYLASSVISSLTTRAYDSAGNPLWGKSHGDSVYDIAHATISLKTLIPGLPIPTLLGALSTSFFSRVPAILVDLSLAIPVSDNPIALPPEWVDIPVARIYRAVLSTPGGSGFLAVPMASFQCIRRLGASTWVAVVMPGYTPIWLAMLQARVGDELLINAGIRNSAGEETLGLFLRATLTAVEYTREPSSAAITLTGRVINPSYSSASRIIIGIRRRTKTDGRWTMVCDADPLLRPNDTATAGTVSFIVGSIRHSVSAHDAFMEVVEDG